MLLIIKGSIWLIMHGFREVPIRPEAKSQPNIEPDQQKPGLLW